MYKHYFNSFNFKYLNLYWLDDIKLYFNSINKKLPQLSDPVFIIKLSFLVCLVNKLNILNNELLGHEKLIVN